MKLKFLDGIRGFAALIVVIHHYQLAFYPSLNSASISQQHIGSGKMEVFLASSPFNILYNGHFAVCVFFILSGFVLSYKFFLEKNPGLIIESIFKRYFRFIIPIGFIVLLSFILIKLGLYYNKEASLVANSSNWFGAFWNFEPSLPNAIKQTLIDIPFFGYKSFNTVFWTMKYEIVGSYCIFLFLYLFGQKPYRLFIYFILIIMIIWVLKDCYYLTFVLGVSLCDFYNNKKYNLPYFYALKNPFVIGIVFSIGIILGSFPINNNFLKNTFYRYLVIEDFIFPIEQFYHIIGAFLLIVIAIASKRVRQIFETEFALLLGKLSFSFYLLHFLILGSLSSYLFIKFESYFSYNIGFLLMFLISILALFYSSKFVYSYVDLLSIRVSNSFGKKLKVLLIRVSEDGV